MKERSIFNQIKMVKLIIDYAEEVKEEGVIVALDQKKAYNKIAHDYLWRVLKEYDLLDNFINTVKILYNIAKTVVMMNGVTSKLYKITRGVQ